MGHLQRILQFSSFPLTMVSWVTGGSHTLKPGRSTLPIKGSVNCSLMHMSKGPIVIYGNDFSDSFCIFLVSSFRQCERDRRLFEFYLTKLMNNSGSASPIKKCIYLSSRILFAKGFTFAGFITPHHSHRPSPYVSLQPPLPCSCYLSCCLCHCFVFLSRPHTVLAFFHILLFMAYFPLPPRAFKLCYLYSYVFLHPT